MSLSKLKNESESGLARLLAFFAVALVVFVFSACGSGKPTDLKTLAPADSILYLEANDLGKALDAVTKNELFGKLTSKKNDLSALNGIQIAVVVTGFETSEKQLTDEASNLNFRPRYAIIAETHSWESSAISLAANQLDRFVRSQFGSETKLDKGIKNGINFFHWTAPDGRKMFASVTGSQIFFGNDESLVEKCLAVKRGEADSIRLSKDFMTAYDQRRDADGIAFGYLSADGVAQFANLAGVSVAIGASEEGDIRSFIAGILPVIIRSTAKDAVWNTKRTESGLEDSLLIRSEPEASSIWKETLSGRASNDFNAASFIPKEFNSFTRYNLQNPQIAWRSVLVSVSKQLDAVSSKVLLDVSGSALEPYGVRDAETFLSTLGNEISTVRFDEEGDETVVIAGVENFEKLKTALASELNMSKPAEQQGSAQLWRSTDNLLLAAVHGKTLILGETESVLKCLIAREGPNNFANSPEIKYFTNNVAAAVTISKDPTTAPTVASVLGTPKEDDLSFRAFSVNQTSFTSTTIDRKSTSDFGFIGYLIAQFNSAE